MLYSPQWLQWSAPKSPPKVPLPVDRSPNCTTCLIPGPVRPMMPNGIWIRFAVFPNALDRQTDRPMDRPTDRSRESLMTIGRCAMTRPKNYGRSNNKEKPCNIQYLEMFSATQNQYNATNVWVDCFSALHTKLPRYVISETTYYVCKVGCRTLSVCPFIRILTFIGPDKMLLLLL